MHCPCRFSASVRCEFRPFIASKARPLRVHASLVTERIHASSSYNEFDQLAHHADATVLTAVGPTHLGRGLLANHNIAQKDPVVSVPIHNSLLIADDPISGISIFSDRQHRRWQEVYGDLPEQLLEFLQGDARWDIRMAAWLLYMKQHPDPLWTTYLKHLPREQDMCCLLNYNRDEVMELQIPALQSEAVVQADWAAFLHGNYLHSKSGQLPSLGLSDNLSLSLWAISMVRSRTFSEDVNGEPLTLMVPYADLANHNFNNNCTFCLSSDNKSFQLQALRPLSAGEEITISYGAIKPNAELLRDYGFFIPGNPCDRINFSAISNRGSSGSSANCVSLAADASNGVRGLNPVSLLEAVGFTGDLAAARADSTADICPRAQSAPDEVLRVARRKAALMSMPLNTPPAAAGGRGGSNSSSSGSGEGANGFASWWFGESMQAWTPAGQPAAQPLVRQQVSAEREAVEVLKHQLLHQLATLPTSIAMDEELLQLHEEMSSRATINRGVGASVSSSSAGGSSVKLPVSTNSSSHWKVHRQSQQQQQQQSTMPSYVGAADALVKAPLSPRMLTAVGARLEHKLLLREAVAVLMLYDKYLAMHL